MPRMKKLLLVLAGATAVLPTLAQAQQQPSVAIGISAGDYFLTDSTIKKAMGDSIFTVGLTPLVFGMPKANTLIPGFNIIGADKNGSNFLLIPVTLGYEWQFADAKSSTIPFARVDAGASYFNYSIEQSGAPTINGSRVGGV